MEDRILIRSLKDHIGKYVNVAGWVNGIRDLKKMQFLILKDHTGIVQGTNFKKGKSLDDVVSSLSQDCVINAGGELITSEAKLHGYEIQLDYVDVQSRPVGPLPISPESNIDQRLDWRYIDLRDPKKHLIFRIQTTAEHAMREFWLQNGFTEIHSPKLVEGASESGAELFKLDYFGQQASLAQSPQFYKQMAMAAGFDRVFEIGPVFRANKSHTFRHDTEFTSVDMEISWIRSHEDVMRMEETWINYFMSEIAAKHGDEIFEKYGVETKVPTLPFPRVTMDDAYKILESQGYNVPREHKGDLDPEGERRLARHIKDNFNHDFVFVTEYPSKARPFYHMRFEERPDTTKSFDLLWKGLEVTTGAQREHRYDKLLEQIHEKGDNPESISSYVNFFKYGCPPHGGCGFGLTRMLMNLTELNNVREVTFIYRGPNRLKP
ncbi:MAG: aspartate--tRNA(Asn) ligase [bacterium]